MACSVYSDAIDHMFSWPEDKRYDRGTCSMPSDHVLEPYNMMLSEYLIWGSAKTHLADVFHQWSSLVCVYVCMYVCMYVFMYVCMYVST